MILLFFMIHASSLIFFYIKNHVVKQWQKFLSNGTIFILGSRGHVFTSDAAKGNLDIEM